MNNCIRINNEGKKLTYPELRERIKSEIESHKILIEDLENAYQKTYQSEKQNVGLNFRTFRFLND